MTWFELIKQVVRIPEAAAYYGLHVSRNGMACCPFHDDRHPSMKLNERYFYCFGCGATGDVIDLVAKLFGLSSYEAAKKLAHDFGIDAGLCGVSGRFAHCRRAGTAGKNRRNAEQRWPDRRFGGTIREIEKGGSYP